MPELAPVQYTRLPGSGISRKGGSFLTATRTNCRLWLGDDHLLQVESAGGYSESYKRFYFRDIQVIYLQKTNSWLMANLVLGLATGAFLLWTLMVKDHAGVIALGIVTGCFGLLLLVNALRGPTCACHLQTAVHGEELPSLRRRRNTEKVLARIKPLIEAAQGSATAETLAPQYATLLEKTHATPAVPGQFSRVVDPTLSVYRSHAHQVLFLALLAHALANLLNIVLPSIPVVLLNLLTGATLAGAVLIALVKQHQTDLLPAVRALTWVTGVFVGLGYVTGYIVMVLMAPGHNQDGTQWGYIKAIADLRPMQTTWWLAILFTTATVAGLLGGIGLLCLRQHWRHQPTAP